MENQIGSKVYALIYVARVTVEISDTLNMVVCAAAGVVVQRPDSIAWQTGQFFTKMTANESGTAGNYHFFHMLV